LRHETHLNTHFFSRRSMPSRIFTGTHQQPICIIFVIMLVLSSSWMLRRFLGDFLGTLKACWCSPEIEGHAILLFWAREFAVWHRFWASRLVQGTVQALMGWERTGGSRTNPGRDRRVVPDSRSGLKTGEFFSLFETSKALDS